MSFTLEDALSHYRHIYGANHKFWGYFQVVAASTTAFAWSRDNAAHGQTFVLLGVAFGVFAILNCRLVFKSQAELVNAASCIKKYAATLQVPAELRPVLEGINPDRAVLVGIWHAGLSVATLASVVWRYQLGPVLTPG